MSGQGGAWDEFAAPRRFGDGLKSVAHLYETYVAPLQTIPALDAALGGGLRPGLNVLAGVSSAGKSAVACNAATAAAYMGKRVLYMTLDDGAETIFDRCCASWTTMAGDVPNKAWSRIQREVVAEVRRQLGPEAGTAGRGDLSRVMERCAMTAGTTCNLVARFAEEVGPNLAIETSCSNASEAAGWVEMLSQAGERPDLVVVDYAQQYRSGQPDFDRDTKERVRATCAALKEVSERNRVCVLLVSAITRESAKGGSEPSLNWLKDSSEVGYLCQTCSILTTPPDGERGDDPDGGGPWWREVELTVVKNKAGQSGDSTRCALWGRYCLLETLDGMREREDEARRADAG